MPNYSKKDPKYKAGYRAAKQSASDSVYRIVDAIVADINARSGLSPMLWSDRGSREAIVIGWVDKVRGELEKV